MLGQLVEKAGNAPTSPNGEVPTCPNEQVGARLAKMRDALLVARDRIRLAKAAPITGAGKHNIGGHEQPDQARRDRIAEKLDEVRQRLNAQLSSRRSWQPMEARHA